MVYAERERSVEREKEGEESRGKKFGHRRIGCVRREREEREEEGEGEREVKEWTIGRAMGT